LKWFFSTILSMKHKHHLDFFHMYKLDDLQTSQIQYQKMMCSIKWVNKAQNAKLFQTQRSLFSYNTWIQKHWNKTFNALLYSQATKLSYTCSKKLMQKWKSKDKNSSPCELFIFQEFFHLALWSILVTNPWP
jgi:hypothetical protein